MLALRTWCLPAVQEGLSRSLVRASCRGPAVAALQKEREPLETERLRGKGRRAGRPVNGRSGPRQGLSAGLDGSGQRIAREISGFGHSSLGGRLVVRSQLLGTMEAGKLGSRRVEFRRGKVIGTSKEDKRHWEAFIDRLVAALHGLGRDGTRHSRQSTADGVRGARDEGPFRPRNGKLRFGGLETIRVI